MPKKTYPPIIQTCLDLDIDISLFPKLDRLGLEVPKDLSNDGVFKEFKEKLLQRLSKRTIDAQAKFQASSQNTILKMLGCKTEEEALKKLQQLSDIELSDTYLEKAYANQARLLQSLYVQSQENCIIIHGALLRQEIAESRGRPHDKEDLLCEQIRIEVKGDNDDTDEDIDTDLDEDIAEDIKKSKDEVNFPTKTVLKERTFDHFSSEAKAYLDYLKRTAQERLDKESKQKSEPTLHADKASSIWEKLQRQSSVVINVLSSMINGFKILNPFSKSKSGVDQTSASEKKMHEQTSHDPLKPHPPSTPSPRKKTPTDLNPHSLPTPSSPSTTSTAPIPSLSTPNLNDLLSPTPTFTPGHVQQQTRKSDVTLGSARVNQNVDPKINKSSIR